MRKIFILFIVLFTNIISPYELNQEKIFWTQDQGFHKEYRIVNTKAKDVSGKVILWVEEIEIKPKFLLADLVNKRLWYKIDAKFSESETLSFRKDIPAGSYTNGGFLASMVGLELLDAYIQNIWGTTTARILLSTSNGIYMTQNTGSTWAGQQLAQLPGYVPQVCASPVNLTSATLGNAMMYGLWNNGVVYRRTFLANSNWSKFADILYDYEDMEQAGTDPNVPPTWERVNDVNNYISRTKEHARSPFTGNDTVNVQYSIKVYANNSKGNYYAKYPMVDTLSRKIIEIYVYLPSITGVDEYVSGIITIIQNGKKLDLLLRNWSFSPLKSPDKVIDYLSVNNWNRISIWCDFDNGKAIVYGTSKYYEMDMDTTSITGNEIRLRAPIENGYTYYVDDISIRPWIYDLVGHTSIKEKVYASTSDGIYRCDSTVWVKEFHYKGAPKYIVSDPVGSYYAFLDPEAKKVYFKETNWVDVTYDLPNTNEYYSIAIDKSGNLYVGSNNYLYRLIKGSSNWVNLKNGFDNYGLHDYVKLIKQIAPVSPETIYVANHNGVYCTYDSGNTWIQDNDENVEKNVSLIPLISKADSIFENNIYPILTTKLAFPSDVNNDGAIHLVLLDIIDTLADGMHNWCYSFFNPVDLDLYNAYSNKSEVIYWDYQLLGKNYDNSIKDISRTMTLLIHYNYDEDEEEWIDNILKQYGVYLTYFGEGNFAGNYSVSGYLKNASNSSAGFTFALYLYENYGNNLIKDILLSPYNSIEGIDSALKNNGISENFYDIFSNYRIALKLDKPPIYGFNYATTIIGEDLIKKFPYQKRISELLEINSLKDTSFVAGNWLYITAQKNANLSLKILKCGNDTIIEDFSFQPYNDGIVSKPFLTYFTYYYFFTSKTGCEVKLDYPYKTFNRPFNLRTISDYLNRKVELVWERPFASYKYFLNFTIFRACSTDMIFYPIATIDSTHFVDNSVFNDSVYYYYVIANYSDCTSSPSDTVKNHPSLFSPPYHLRGYQDMNNNVFLYWFPPEYWRNPFLESKNNLLYYKIYRKIDSSPYTLIKINYTNHFYNDPNVTGDTIIYKISAVYKYGSSVLERSIEKTIEKYNNFVNQPTYIPSFITNDVGFLSAVVSNFGLFGYPNADQTGNPSYDWPNFSGYYYLWEGRLWIGAKVGENIYVSHADYGSYEFSPSDTSWKYYARGKGDLDIVSEYVDYEGYYTNSYKLGLKIIQRCIGWAFDPILSHAKAYEIYIIYNKSKFNITGVQAPNKLRDVYVSICFDADISEADNENPHIDDLVCYDGWTGNEWINLSHFPSPSDEYTILKDTIFLSSDGYPDQGFIYGDDPDENTVYNDTFFVYRNMSYMYDGDDPATIEDDTGDNGLSPGYIFANVIYAPPSGSDSIYIGKNNDTIRIIRPASHSWWNWNDDPGTDKDKYLFMSGRHPKMFGYKFLPHPYDLGASVFDYRFNLSLGPFTIANNETICIVIGTGVGYGLNGGYEPVFFKRYIPGARTIADRLITKYYEGSQHSDPLHPSGPDDDIHWGYNGKKKNDIYTYNLNMPTIAFDNNLKFTITAPKTEKYKFKIFDICGRQIKYFEKTIEGGMENLIYINIENMKKGVYFITVSNENRVLDKRKLIILR